MSRKCRHVQRCAACAQSLHTHRTVPWLVPCARDDCVVMLLRDTDVTESCASPLRRRRGGQVARVRACMSTIHWHGQPCAAPQSTTGLMSFPLSLEFGRKIDLTAWCKYEIEHCVWRSERCAIEPASVQRSAFDPPTSSLQTVFCTRQL